MGHVVRTHRMPPGTLIRLDRNCWQAPFGTIQMGCTGLVIEHYKPAVIKVFWFGWDDKGRKRDGVSTLTPDHLGVTMSGYTDTFSVISLPEGMSYSTWE